MNHFSIQTINKTFDVEQHPLGHSQHVDFPVSLKERQYSIIKDIATSSFKELLVSLTLTGVACFFVATPAIPTLLLTTVGVVAINILIKSMSGYVAYEIEMMKEQSSINKKELKALQLLHAFLQYLCPINFSLLDITTRNVLIHEAGHAFAATTLYQNARPTIEIFPLKGGVTKYWPGALTKVGQFFGSKCSRLIVISAGPAAGIFAATIDISLAHYFKEKYPELHLYFLCTAISNIAQHVLYALSALWEKNPSKGHDFANLWKLGGIHPIASVICMVALPLIVKTVLFTISYYRQMKSEADIFSVKAEALTIV